MLSSLVLWLQKSTTEDWHQVAEIIISANEATTCMDRSVDGDFSVEASRVHCLHAVQIGTGHFSGVCLRAGGGGVVFWRRRHGGSKGGMASELSSSGDGASTAWPSAMSSVV